MAVIYKNKTKIVATLGPASANCDMILKLIHAGVRIFRINFSHGTQSQHKQTIRLIHKINREHGAYIAIMADLQGPKIRLGMVEENLPPLKSGDFLEFTTKEMTGNNKRVYINYPQFPKDVEKGDVVLVDDGRIELKVVSTNRKDLVKTKVIHGNTLASKKGVNLPDTKVSIPSLTPKDYGDLIFALDQNVHWVALSFVRKETDIIALKKIIQDKKKLTKVIAKIEKPEALKNIDAIISASDAIMVARGDLGVEMPVENVPFIQKDITRRCNAKAKPVIIATQMMDSMISNARPTRAEATDVANAVLDGADAVMLSAETATGRHPDLVVSTMANIIEEAEKEESVYNRQHVPDKSSRTFLSDAVCFNACRIADEVNAFAIMGMTKTGYTAFMVSSCRPKAHIYIFTNNKHIVNTLNLLWGVKAFYYAKLNSTNETFEEVQNLLKRNVRLKAGDVVLNLGTMPVKEFARTNVLKISTVK